MPAPSEFLTYIDTHADQFINGRLTEAVKKPSISTDPNHRQDDIDMGLWIKDQLESFGLTTTAIDLGPQMNDGQTVMKGDEPLQLPYLILGRAGEDPEKKTVLVYCHYDVQPADMKDGWKYDPWTLTETSTHQLYGRGSTDDKGPLCGWLNVLEAHKNCNLDLPVNLRFCFEGMEESDSEGLDNWIIAEAKKPNHGWFAGVNCVCITDNYWLNTRSPCLTYGVRGVVAFDLNIAGPQADLHSGLFGGMVYEPMTDLVHIMSKLVAPNGRILIPNIYDGTSLQPGEKEEYEKLDWTLDDLKEITGTDVALYDDKASELMGRMRFPSLSLHGINGAYSDSGFKTVIPHSVTGKFSVRIVPPQDPKQIAKLVEDYVKQEWALLQSKGSMSITTSGEGKPWIANNQDWHFSAAAKATYEIYQTQPDLTREGGSVPVTVTFSEALGSNVSVLLLPMGRSDDGAHSTNEKIDRANFIGGSKLFGAYLYEVAAATISS
ncbi:uncharacterized protein FIBRA_03389 [Fibroporia radiculosa]|uniref:Peptidase M20 dimerisation domain-containing protein n=1 Tax=Fibroporia radiculosa TaxID=599839 RepID=J4H2D6_9APHY|nr:uncharacterized protein FIBRA_03389 [Fibroporia radiculosa]CCM01339.1 predicted protein [Fibroporia radiculosa]